MSVLGQRLEIVEKGGRINDVTELIERAPRDSDRYALHYFCRWITDIYHYSQAGSLGAVPSVPSYDPVEGAMATQLARGVQSGAGQYRTIRLTVAMPRPQWIADVPPHQLLGLVRELGMGYREALGDWHREPTGRTEAKVRSALQRYADELAKCTRLTPSSFLEVQVGKGGRVDTGVALALGGTVGYVARSLWAPAEALMVLGAAAWALYRWHRNRPEHTELTLEAAHKPAADEDEPEASRHAGNRPDLNIGPS